MKIEYNVEQRKLSRKASDLRKRISYHCDLFYKYDDELKKVMSKITEIENNKIKNGYRRKKIICLNIIY
jgi:hypothetical protein